MRSLVAGIVAAGLGLGALWLATDGLRALTTDAALRVAVERAPRALPPVALTDQNGQTVRFDAFEGRLILVDFFYSRCTDLCPILNDAMARIRDALPPAALGRDLVLLSISFDRPFDSVEELQRYARIFDADGVTWRMTRVDDADGLRALLETFGVVVIADGHGGFQHNGAIHLVGRDGRLRQVYGYDAPEEVAADISREL